jgi:hypothetical protein
MAMSLAEMKATLREGDYAWPGGYPKFFITSDNAVLSFAAVRSNMREVMRSTFTEARDGWQVEAVAVNWEDGDLTCDHTGERIPCAYPTDDEGE